MNCATCGTPVGPDDAFCPSCGASLAPAAPTTPLPNTPPRPVAPQPAAPTQVMPQVASAQQSAYPPPGSSGTWAPPSGAYSAQQAPQPGYSAPTYGQQSQGAAPKKGLSTGAIIGIVAGGVVLLILLGVGGFFGLKALRSKAAEQVARLNPSATATSSAPAVDTTAVDEAIDGASGAVSDSDDAAAPDDEIITDEQARATVTSFMDARLDRDVNTSREYCSNNFWNGEWHDMLVDDTWRPETYEIVNTQPDLMYVHVVVSEVWPSGQEYWIYSCLKDPSTGRAVIDGTLDPANVPEMIP